MADPSLLAEVMPETIPFPIEAIGWNELTELGRDFFCFQEEYLPLPDAHAAQIGRLNSESAQRILRWLGPSLPNGWPEAKPHFDSEVVLRLDAMNWNTEEGTQSVRQWLHDRGIPYVADVFLLYDIDRVVRMPWKLVVQYWDALAWSVGYAMIAMDHTRQWACCFHHEDAIVFGTFSKKET